ncbi:MAG: FN3 domain-containing metallophosphoesterase family protein [Planctomycetia bacterium]|nr:FN3 domain-containing metallophosphoesterase family protein [Planctomycetia bacterium]
MKRRFFLGSLAGLGGFLISGSAQGVIEDNPVLKDEKKKMDLNDIVDSFPILQNPTPDGMSVCWAIRRPGTGYVEWGTTPKLGNIARDSYAGLFPYEDRFLSSRIEGLLPGTTYYYRTVSIGMDFPQYGKMLSGDPVYCKIHSFKTPDPAAKKASFFVMNDTHANQAVLDRLTQKILEKKPDYTLWNGDTIGDINSADLVVKGIMQAGNRPYASSIPLLFAAGNHDHRGPWARNLVKAFLPWNTADPEFRTLAWNFSVRQGPLAILGMDTGEDKPDKHPIWKGLADFDDLRKLQARWLEKTLNKPEIKSAPFVVVCCHIPLFDPDPAANPGEILENWADWQSRCAELWGPIFNKYGVQAVIVGHKHRLIPSNPPDEKRKWFQIRGGGPNLESNGAFIHVSADQEKMVICREILKDGSCDEEWSFKKRF